MSGDGPHAGSQRSQSSLACPPCHDGTRKLALVSLVSANDHAVWTVTQALAINESGVVLATATRDEGGRHPKEHPVLLRPVSSR